ncbi:hypothetical protein MY04_0871 [Flammeovirga sp. MY04]|uniref:HYC_CC_PP family protein n=1 Tax=Flammeovirga sp. MY04 TaxID=1191459 RepID=UPI0008064390|nr:hypothetical protein [Flammeovirga sp. MY04]ANQ48253.1 hypothetical protein MY04_0871 [Flammeovirga sp. MY04]
MKSSIQHIIFSTLLLLGTIGVVVNTHYCKGLLKEVSMTETHACCNKMNHEADQKGVDKKGCCEQNKEHLKVTDHFDHIIDVVKIPLVTYKEVVRNFWQSAYQFVLPEALKFLVGSTKSIASVEEKTPPIYSNIPLNVSFEVFRV